MGIENIYLGHFFMVLLEKLSSGELLEFLRRLGIEDLLEELRTTLLMIKVVLTDAENKQLDRPVRKWLRDPESSAYNLDELLDRVIKNPSLRKNEGRTSKLRKLIPTCFNFSFPGSTLADGTASKLRNISSRFKVLSKEISKLDLVENVTREPYRTGERFQMASFMEESLTVTRAYRPCVG
ncbi:Hypothetical predicted protein [Olea europaea subsp. europaea]|uniref:Disease resistance N-terminal domain-containing protein n=1 Tax=Olea europaea subsp. europaea TaxID=158383 RepID=A0A8S0PMV9_OLEEU|nr:Hypothetical predicted protein [Olea europaea subsp. europaea]